MLWFEVRLLIMSMETAQRGQRGVGGHMTQVFWKVPSVGLRKCQFNLNMLPSKAIFCTGLWVDSWTWPTSGTAAAPGLRGRAPSPALSCKSRDRRSNSGAQRHATPRDPPAFSR